MNQHKKSYQLRAEASRVLFDILENGMSAREALPARQRHFEEKDKAWLQEMVYGVLRQLPLLQHWLRGSLDRPLKKNAKVVEHLIMLGLYQLAFTRVSTHAAVSETVSACKHLNNINLKGLVNAILRGFIRDEKEQQLPDDPIVVSGLPKWLYKRLAKAYPEQLDDIVTQTNNKPPIWLRVNQTKCSTQDYHEHLDRKGIDHNVSDLHSHAIVLDKPVDVTKLPGYQDGWFAVQDGAAQFAASFLGAQPGDRVLDCCAAPGGKTCHILEQTPQVRQCIALDSDKKRLQRVDENLERLGLNASVVCADATSPDKWWDGDLFDRILLDAPCSATGVIRKHPDIRWLRKSADIDALVSLQAKILDACWRMLKPGGTLLYATCSILPEENHKQISAFLAIHQDATLDNSGICTDTTQVGRQILPGESQMDGFYYARLLKSGTESQK